jgi:predicted aspartyl protease
MEPSGGQQMTGRPEPFGDRDRLPASPTRRRAAAGLLAALAGASPLAAHAQRPDLPPGAETLPGRKDWTSRLTTPVFINGAGPFDFVVDTGANRSVIAVELAEALGLPPGRPERIHGILSAEDAPSVNAQSFTAGSIRLPLVDVPLLRRADLGCDGFLGLDAFRDRRVAFDFRRGRVSILSGWTGALDFTRPPGALSSDVTVAARQRLGQLMIVDAQAANQRISCFIDSGAQRSVGNMAMRRAVKARTADASFAPIPVVLHGATGQDAYGEVAEVPVIGIGPLRFTGFRMAFADLHTFSLWGMQDRPAMMVGMDLLSLFALVLVDFRQNVVRFRMAQAFTPPPPA